MKRKILPLFAMLTILCAAAGCAQTKHPLFSDSFSETAPELEPRPSSPQFWEDAAPVSGCGNLYELHSSLFDGRPYNDLAAFGGNILFIGQAYYSDHAFDEPDAIYADGKELEYQYSFELYDPWRNSFIAELPPEEIQCDDYQVAGDRLLLIDSAEEELSLYDGQLQFIGSYDISGLNSDDDCRTVFYPSGSPDTLYTCSNSENALLELTFLSETIQVGKHALPFLDASLCSVSPDGSRLLFSGTDPLSLGYCMYIVDSGTWETADVFPGASYLTGDLSSGAVLADTNYSAGYWLFQEHGEAPSYFYWPDARDAVLLPDESIVFSSETGDGYSSRHLLSYCRYAPTGEVLSSFTYDCGQTASDSGIYIGNRFAYMEDLDVCFLLVYTLDAHPYLLIWEPSVPAADAAQPLEYYPDELHLVQNHPFSYQGETADDGEPYGTTVTLIDDPEHYDWGALSDINARADALETQYGISIYLGPEIPERIDCFSTEQETDPGVLTSALDELSRILSCYPENFFSQLCFGENRGIHIYLTGTISSSTPGMLDSPSGFVNEINSYMVMVLDSEYAWDWDYTVSHEFSHMIDRRLEFRTAYYEDSVYSEDTWNSLNPPGNEYLFSYDGYADNPLYLQTPEYYISSYGLTYPTEDRAEMFGTAMQDYLGSASDAREKLSAGQPAAEKYGYYCQCIRDGFDTDGWAESMPWEQILSRG